MLSICVVTHDRLEYTKQCLESIISGTDVPYELIVVDSGSSDETPAYLVGLSERALASAETYYYGLFLENVGAAIAYNKAFTLAKGDVIVRIDNDVLVPPGWASSLLEWLDSDPNLGMLATDLVTDRITPIGVAPSRIHYIDGPIWHDRGVGSWCIAMRRAMFDEVGYYRPLFGPYALQDNDLEKRAQNAGWRIGTLCGLTVRHLYSNEDPVEAEFNAWKIQQYNEQISTWDRVWSTSQ